MFFVRVAFAEEEFEQVMALACAGAEPAGVDEGVLADGRSEFYVYFADRAQAAAAVERLRPYETSLEVAEQADWNAAWQAGWEPVAVGRRWWLVPPGWPGDAPEGRVRLEYHAGLAFGNGDHPTTQLCLEWMEEVVRPGDRVLDLGCGSGLLCQAAAALGATGIGCDIDADAVRSAVDRGVAAFVGSVDAVGSVDVIVANLALGVLERLMPEIRRVARREILVSGLLTDQPFAGERRDRDGWSAVRIQW